jgi:hypothetical protein
MDGDVTATPPERAGHGGANTPARAGYEASLSLQVG